MTGVEAVLWAGAAALGIGAVAILLMGGFATPRQQARTAIHALVCVIACIAYIVMASGHGSLGDAGDVTGFKAVRYIDWGLTTPLLLLGLAIAATPRGQEIGTTVAALILANTAMVAAGAIAAMAPGGLVWVWFAASSLAFAVVLWVLWGILRGIANAGHPIRSELYVRHAGLLTALWLAYPFVFLGSPQMLGLFGAGGADVAFAILDVASKAGYGLLVVIEDDRLTEIEGTDATAPRTGTGEMPATTAATGRVRRANWEVARDRVLAVNYRGRPLGAHSAGTLLPPRGLVWDTARQRFREVAGPDARRDLPRRIAAMAERSFAVQRPRQAPPAPRRPRRKPVVERGMQTPFGAVRKDDIAPALLVAAALLIITSRPRD